MVLVLAMERKKQPGDSMPGASDKRAPPHQTLSKVNFLEKDLALRSVLPGQHCCLHCVDEEAVGLVDDLLSNRHTVAAYRSWVPILWELVLR